MPAQALPRLERNSAVRIERMPWPGVPRIWLPNVTRPPMDDVRVRQAINYAVDKEAFLATVYKGTGLKAIAPLTAVMLDDPALRQSYPFNPVRARELLGEAGWQPGADGIRMKSGQRLEIVLNAIEYGGGTDPTAQLIQSALREVGIDVRIHSSLVGGNFNWSCYKNPKADQLLEQGRHRVGVEVVLRPADPLRLSPPPERRPIARARCGASRVTEAPSSGWWFSGCWPWWPWPPPGSARAIRSRRPRATRSGLPARASSSGAISTAATSRAACSTGRGSRSSSGSSRSRSRWRWGRPSASSPATTAADSTPS